MKKLTPMTFLSKEIRNVEGKVVAHIKDDILYKKVKRSKHLHRVLNSWGMDSRILEEEFSEVKILDIENDQIYIVPKHVWVEHGIKKNFGHGDQTFLPLHYFQVLSKNQPSLI